MKDVLRPRLSALVEAYDKEFDEYAVEMGMTAIISAFTFWYDHQDVSLVDLIKFIGQSLMEGMLRPKLPYLPE